MTVAGQEEEEEEVEDWVGEEGGRRHGQGQGWGIPAGDCSGNTNMIMYRELLF